MTEKKDKKRKSVKKDSKETKLRKELQSAKEEVQQLREKYLRLMAEFDNFRKRSAKEILILKRTAAEEVLSKLLGVIDDFDRAKQLSDDEKSSENFTEGVELVYNKLKNTLQQLGLEHLEPTGDTFNPEEHEAITRIPVQDEEQKGKVVDTIEKGYKLHEKVLRHPKVVVGH